MLPYLGRKNASRMSFKVDHSYKTCPESRAKNRGNSKNTNEYINAIDDSHPLQLTLCTVFRISTAPEYLTVRFLVGVRPHLGRNGRRRGSARAAPNALSRGLEAGLHRRFSETHGGHNFPVTDLAQTRREKKY